MSKFSQQNLVILERYELIEIIFDGFVTYGTPPAEHAKVKAIFEPCLSEGDPADLPREQICVTFYDRPADVVAGFMDGETVNISAKIKSRLVQPNDPTLKPFDVTEVVGYFVEKWQPRRQPQQPRHQQQQQQQPATRQRSGGSERAGRQGEQPTQPADTDATAETGRQRTRTPETYRPTRR